MPNIRRHILSVLTSLLLAQVLPAQDYFQQAVNYTIEVELDDQAHTLSGEIAMEYTNQSPWPLDSIWIHLWGNAFSQPLTDFGKQMLRQGESQYYFAKDSDRGSYSRLDFSANGKKAAWHLLPGRPDLAVVRLGSPLQPGETLLLTTPFALKIPDSFSRLGHVGTSYQMTQWYPKPAVLDPKGWHPIPNLNQGEYYSEFGNYEVSITLPENYVVGATGTLQTESEQQFLNEKAAATRMLIQQGFSKDTKFPASSASKKTIRYTAENVHDFAWFADKRFHVLRDEAVLPSGKKVTTWAMFTNEEADLWTQGAFYVKRAVEFYSKHVGEYPWPQATAVQSALSAGAGMEYPMITVIGKSGTARALDNVITHEVGHNWFYGILASNERDHAWLDEGLNSYYEYRYMETFYGQRGSMSLPRFLSQGGEEDLFELAYLFQCRRAQDQAPETTSDAFQRFNYGISAYAKPAFALWHLAAYLGQDRFDQAMKSYYDTWKFRHPYPEDFRQQLEAITGTQLAWLFDGYLGSTRKLDYALTGLGAVAGGQGEAGLVVENRGGIEAPFPVSAFRGDSLVATRWFEGFSGKQVIAFPDCGPCDRYVLDAGQVTLDTWRKNNYLMAGGAFKTLEPLQWRIGGFLENSRRTTINLLPTAGWNAYDGFSLGLLNHNGLVPGRETEYQLMPGFGFGSKALTGMGRLQSTHYLPTSRRLRSIVLGFEARQYGYRSINSLQTAGGFESAYLSYRRLNSFVRLDMKYVPSSRFYQFLQWRVVDLSEERARFSGGFYTGNGRDNRYIQELSWELGDKRVLNPYAFRLALEHSSYKDPFERQQRYLKASLEWRSEWVYDVERSVSVRFFAGKFFQSDERNRSSFLFPEAFNMTGQGFNDYRYDELYIGRTETSGLWSRQISQREGGMKIPLGSPYQAGRSNTFLVALNLKADLPGALLGKLPLKPYFDIGYFEDQSAGASQRRSDRLWWQGGLALELGGGIAGVYLPLVSAPVIGGREREPGLYDFSGRDKFWERIAFTFNLSELSPWRLRDQVSL
jgi:hypothetical protein